MTVFFAKHTSDEKFYLRLNNMRSSLEDMIFIGPFQNPQQILDYYREQCTEPYFEESADAFSNGTKKYSKTFQEGNLYWCNPIPSLAGRTGKDVILEDFVIRDDLSYTPGIVCVREDFFVLNKVIDDGVNECLTLP